MTTMTTTYSFNAQWQLSTQDPAAYSVINADATSNILFICDHATNAIPAELDNLGVTGEHLNDHIAWDPGTVPVATFLAEYFQSTLVTCGYSRLLIDPNRTPGSEGSIPAISDNVIIPGNQQISSEEAKKREDLFFWPYHNAIDAQLEKIQHRGQQPVVISIHSFTPALKSQPQRPWQLGILWDKDGRVAQPLIDVLRSNQGLCVGDNEPYRANYPDGYTIPAHAEQFGFHQVLIEIRNDLIQSEKGVETWGQLLAEALQDALQQAGAINP